MGLQSKAGRVLKPYGIAGREMKNKDDAAWMTYTTKDGRLPATPLVVKENPYNELVSEARVVLEVGCGVGRNAPWVLENTGARYIGVDPNESMMQHFWAYVDQKYLDRVELHHDFTTIPDDTRVDVVVSIFVMQHLNYELAPQGAMTPSDIAREVQKFTHLETVWFFLENGRRDQGWMAEFMLDLEIEPEVFVSHWEGTPGFPFPDLAHRGAHNLIIWKGA